MQEVMTTLNAKMGNLTGLAGQLQKRAAAGQLSAVDAVEQVLTAFLSLLAALRGKTGGNSKAAAALDRCQEQANVGARMLRDAAGRQQGGISADQAVVYMTDLLQQLTADLSAELVGLSPADAAAKLGVSLGSSDGTGAAPGWRATPSQSGARPSGSSGDALQQLQGVLAGGVEAGLAAAGGAVKEVGC